MAAYNAPALSPARLKALEEQVRKSLFIICQRANPIDLFFHLVHVFHDSDAQTILKRIEKSFEPDANINFYMYSVLKRRGADSVCIFIQALIDSGLKDCLRSLGIIPKEQQCQPNMSPRAPSPETECRSTDQHCPATLGPAHGFLKENQCRRGFHNSGRAGDQVRSSSLPDSGPMHCMEHVPSSLEMAYPQSNTRVAENTILDSEVNITGKKPSSFSADHKMAFLRSAADPEPSYERCHSSEVEGQLCGEEEEGPQGETVSHVPRTPLLPPNILKSVENNLDSGLASLCKPSVEKSVLPLDTESPPPASLDSSGLLSSPQPRTDASPQPVPTRHSSYSRRSSPPRDASLDSLPTPPRNSALQASLGLPHSISLQSPSTPSNNAGLQASSALPHSTIHQSPSTPSHYPSLQSSPIQPPSNVSLDSPPTQRDGTDLQSSAIPREFTGQQSPSTQLQSSTWNQSPMNASTTSTDQRSHSATYENASSSSSTRSDTQLPCSNSAWHDLQQDADDPLESIHRATSFPGADLGPDSDVCSESAVQPDADVERNAHLFHQPGPAARTPSQPVRGLADPVPSNIHIYNIGSVKVNGEGAHLNIGGQKTIYQSSFDQQDRNAIGDREQPPTNGPPVRQRGTWFADQAVRTALGTVSSEVEATERIGHPGQATGIPELLEQPAFSYQYSPNLGGGQPPGQTGSIHHSLGSTEHLPEGSAGPDLSVCQLASAHHETRLKRERCSEPARVPQLQRFSQTSDTLDANVSNRHKQTYLKQGHCSVQHTYPARTAGVQVSNTADLQFRSLMDVSSCTEAKEMFKQPCSTQQPPMDFPAPDVSDFQAASSHHETRLKTKR